jgi:UDP-2-acetamido-3-amino-2,3-dideoxy-glucuronate N-acetyltransferase
LRQECQHFIDCIVNHTEPRSCGRDGLEVVKILEAAQHSLMNGQAKEVIQW